MKRPLTLTSGQWIVVIFDTEERFQIQVIQGCVDGYGEYHVAYCKNQLYI